MATSPLNDPITHLTAMIGQLVRQNQTLISHIDRVAQAVSENAQDMRAHHTGTNKSVTQMRSDVVGLQKDLANLGTELTSVRTEMLARFDSVGIRFDEVEERLGRIERNLDAARSDIMRIENGVINAQQSALQAHLRLDEGGPQVP